MHELEALTATELQGLIDSGVSVAVVPFGSIEHQGAPTAETGRPWTPPSPASTRRSTARSRARRAARSGQTPERTRVDG